MKSKKETLCTVIETWLENYKTNRKDDITRRVPSLQLKSTHDYRV